MQWYAKKAIAGLLALAAGTTAGAAGATANIGAVSQQEYTGAIGILPSGHEEALEQGVPVFAQEIVVTGPTATTSLLFKDTSTLQIGSNSRTVLDRFVYDPEPGTGLALIALGRGAFRFVTGFTKPEDNLTIRTPTLGMAVRGTHLLIYVLGDGTSEVNVVHGKIEVRPCRYRETIPVETGRAILVDSSCAVSLMPMRPPTPFMLPPEMPADLALLDLEPAAGPAEEATLAAATEDDPPTAPAPTGGSVGDHGGTASRSSSAASTGGTPGGGTPGGDPGGGDPGGGDPGGGDPGGGGGNGKGGNGKGGNGKGGNGKSQGHGYDGGNGKSQGHGYDGGNGKGGNGKGGNGKGGNGKGGNGKGGNGKGGNGKGGNGKGGNGKSQGH